MVRQYRWMLPFFAVVLGALVVASAVQTDPRAALHGRGLVVLIALVGYLGGLGWGIVYRTRLQDPPTSWRLLGLVGACALALAIVQPDGAGTLALFITLGVACSRLEPRRAIPGFSDRHRRRHRAPQARRAGGHDVGRPRDRRRQRDHLLLPRLHRPPVPARPGPRGADGRGARGRPRGAGRGDRAARARADGARDARRARPLALGPRRAARGHAAAGPQHRRGPRGGRGRRAQPPAREGRPGGGAARDRRAARRRHARARRPARARRRLRGADRRADPAAHRRRAARAPARRAARDLPHGAGGAHQRPPPRRGRARRAAAPLRRGRHVADRRRTTAGAPSTARRRPGSATGSPGCASAPSCSTAGSRPRRRATASASSSTCRRGDERGPRHADPRAARGRPAGGPRGALDARRAPAGDRGRGHGGRRRGGGPDGGRPCARRRAHGPADAARGRRRGHAPAGHGAARRRA